MVASTGFNVLDTNIFIGPVSELSRGYLLSW